MAAHLIDGTEREIRRYGGVHARHYDAFFAFCDALDKKAVLLEETVEVTTACDVRRGRLIFRRTEPGLYEALVNTPFIYSYRLERDEDRRWTVTVRRPLSKFTPGGRTFVNDIRFSSAHYRLLREAKAAAQEHFQAAQDTAIRDFADRMEAEIRRLD